MATKRSAFPDLRLWIIVNNLNQRVHRTFAHQGSRSPQFLRQKTWNHAARRMRRYLLLQLESAPVPSSLKANARRNPDQIPGAWKLHLAMLVRTLRRQSHERESRWQRRIFQILDSDCPHIKPNQSHRSRAWQVCFQILTSHNHFLKLASDSNQPKPEQTWQHTLWRIAHLKKRITADIAIPPIWAICFRIILADSLRSRSHGWYKRFTAMTYVLRYDKSKACLYLHLL